MVPIKDPAEYGRYVAEKTAKVMKSIYRGNVMRDPEPFGLMKDNDRVVALEAYVKALLNIAKDNEPNCTEGDVRAVLIKQMGRVLMRPSLKKLIQERRVNDLMRCYEPLWMDGGSNIEETAKKINSIFQKTQTDYANTRGIIYALYGFRMVGQSTVGKTNPFLISEKTGVDLIAVRLSFLLRHIQNKGTGIQRAVNGKKAGEDLALCWKHCVENCLDEITSQEVSKDDKKIEAIYRGGDQLSKLHPESLAKCIQLWEQSRIETFLENKEKCKYGDKITSLVKSVHLLGLARKKDCAGLNPAPMIKM